MMYDESRRETVDCYCLVCGQHHQWRALKASIAPREPQYVAWCASCRKDTMHQEQTAT